MMNKKCLVLTDNICLHGENLKVNLTMNVWGKLSSFFNKLKQKICIENNLTHFVFGHWEKRRDMELVGEFS